MGIVGGLPERWCLEVNLEVAMFEPPNSSHHTVHHIFKILVSIEQSEYFDDKITAAEQITNATSDALVAAASVVTSTVQNRPILDPNDGLARSGNTIYFHMMDVKEKLGNDTLHPDYLTGQCMEREAYTSLYLTLLICFVTVGLTASLFVLTVIGWFPDLYSTSKYICQVLKKIKNKNRFRIRLQIRFESDFKSDFESDMNPI